MCAIAAMPAPCSTRRASRADLPARWADDEERQRRSLLCSPRLDAREKHVAPHKVRALAAEQCVKSNSGLSEGAGARSRIVRMPAIASLSAPRVTPECSHTRCSASSSSPAIALRLLRTSSTSLLTCIRA
jgi:hypothetical protein